MVISELTSEVRLFTTGTNCFSGGSWKALSPGSLSPCSIQSGLTATHNHLCFEELRHQLLPFQPHLHLTVSASIVKTFSVRGVPPTRRPDPESQGLYDCRTIIPDEIYDDFNHYTFPPLDLAGQLTSPGEGSFSTAHVFSPFTGSLSSISDNHLRFNTYQIAWSADDEHTASNDWVRSVGSVLKITGEFTGVYNSSFISYLSLLKNLSVDSPRSVLYPSSFSSGENILSPFSLPMARDVSSALLLSVCFSFFIGLLSCGAVSTGPEDTTKIISVILVDEVWTSTSHYVTILQLSGFVVKAPSTHPSIVLNSLSSSVEDLFYLTYLSVVFFANGQRRRIIPSFYCMEEP